MSRSPSVHSTGFSLICRRPPRTVSWPRALPPPPPAVSPVRGLIDFHTHAAPDVFGRALDDDWGSMNDKD